MKRALGIAEKVAYVPSAADVPITAGNEDATAITAVATIGDVPADAQIDLGKLVEEWLIYLKMHTGVKTAQTERTYRNAVKQMFAYFQRQGKSVFAVSDNDVFAWLENLRSEKSPSTTQLYLSAARAFFGFLCKQKLIGENPAEGMKAGVKLNREHKRDYLSVAKVQQLLAAMPASTEMQLRDRAVVALMITTGLRCCEVQKALYEDLRTAGDSAVLYIQGKGHSSKDAFVKISPDVAEMIWAYTAARFNGKTPRGTDYLFVSTSRNRKKIAADDELSTQAIRAIVKAAMKKIGYDDSRHTAHSLRHTAATLGLRAGKDVTEVQQVLRHSNIQTTLIYSHALEREKNDTELAIGRLIFGDAK